MRLVMEQSGETIKNNYYAIIPANVRYDKSLSANAKLLYGEITALCNQEGYCWATNQYFADLYEVSKSTISRWVKELNDAGYIFLKIKYKDGSKEIENRQISIISDTTPIRKSEEGYTQKQVDPIRKSEEGSTQKCVDPIRKNRKDNNTVNNTINNTMNSERVGYTKHGVYNNVLLTEQEFGKLKDTHPQKYSELIDYFSVYLKSSGKTYADHYATIILWEKQDSKKETHSKSKKYSKVNAKKESYPEWWGDHVEQTEVANESLNQEDSGEIQDILSRLQNIKLQN